MAGTCVRSPIPNRQWRMTAPARRPALLRTREIVQRRDRHFSMALALVWSKDRRHGLPCRAKRGERSASPPPASSVPPDAASEGPPCATLHPSQRWPRPSPRRASSAPPVPASLPLPAAVFSPSLTPSGAGWRPYHHLAVVESRRRRGLHRRRGPGDLRSHRLHPVRRR